VGTLTSMTSADESSPNPTPAESTSQQGSGPGLPAASGPADGPVTGEVSTGGPATEAVREQKPKGEGSIDDLKDAKG
jgi:hypothetical protein